MNLVLLTASALIVSAYADLSAVELVHDIYKACLQDFKTGCVKPKAVAWADEVADKNVIRVTEDLILVRKYDPETQEERGLQKDILDKFEDFLQTHNLVARAPAILRPDGPFGKYVPRSFQPTDISVPLAASGRSSKIVKKVIFPFLLGLKFKTAVLVPLALTLIALKTWKALTLGLLSLVLTGAIAIFSRFVAKPPTYEVLHYPQPLEHIDYHHVDVVPAAPALAYGHPVYASRSLDAQKLAYESYSD